MAEVLKKRAAELRKLEGGIRKNYMLFPECPTIGIKAAIVRELHVTTSGENSLACLR
jgi:hypothetical protein